VTGRVTDAALIDLSKRHLLPPPFRCRPDEVGLETNSDVDYAGKYRGALVGGAIGDALGRPVEGLRPQEIQRTYGAITDFHPLPGSPPAPAGRITDDTQMTICIAESIVASQGVHPSDIAQRFVRWLPEGRGVGMTCAAAVHNLMRGHPWHRSGLLSAGNGAAMRVAPVGLLHPLSPTELRQDAALTAVITHADPMAVVSAVAHAFSVAYCLHRRPGTFDVAHYLASLALALSDLHDPGYPERRSGSRTHPVRLADRIAELGAMLSRAPREAFEYLQNGAFVLESLPAALWCFLRSPEDPERVIVTAVGGGHDADTVASMAGALTGAYLGEGGLPERWRSQLEFADELCRLADQILRVSGVTSPKSSS